MKEITEYNIIDYIKSLGTNKFADYAFSESVVERFLEKKYHVYAPYEDEVEADIKQSFKETSSILSSEIREKLKNL